ncbi:MAG TPA: methyltransferase domain-containing protein [Magnetospirillum sp.]|nr:methyltransferase domain-containing protein [Magnetospirillum sp.]
MDTVIDLPVDKMTPYGKAWLVPLPLNVCGNAEGCPDRSRLRLFEDDRELGPAQRIAVYVPGLDGGRFLHWIYELYFSVPDGSDPRTNGRRYRAVLPQPAAFDHSPLAVAARYAITTAEQYLAMCLRHGIPVDGTALLEIGPCGNMAAPLLLACMGMRVSVADRYPPQWDDGHAELYEMILGQWKRPDGALRAALRQRGWDGIVTVLAEPAERLTSLDDGSMDVVVSNAVLEHLYDLGGAVAELARVSRPGAWHFHQFDLRDHKNMAKPLEHLLLTKAEFDASLRDSRWQRGCQTRLPEFLQLFGQHGFDLQFVQPDAEASCAYLADLLSRLRASDSPYRTWPEADLKALGALVVMRRAGGDIHGGTPA